MMARGKTKWPAHARELACLVALALAAITAVPTQSAQPRMAAHFEKTGTTFTDTFEVGPAGGTFRIPVRGKPTDRVVLELTAKAIDQPVRLRIGHCSGRTKVATGTPSHIVLTIETSPAVTFEKPLRISVSFPPDARYSTLVGYAIEENGRFRSLDLADLDVNTGRASFLTFRPVTFTWVYVAR